MPHGCFTLLSLPLTPLDLITMSLLYDIRIDPSEQAGHFKVTWRDVERESVDSFQQSHCFVQSSSEIMPEEMEWMWKDRRNQLRIGEKLFRFLNGKDGRLQQALQEAENRAQPLQVNLYLP